MTQSTRAIHTDGLPKRYGSTLALDSLWRDPVRAHRRFANLAGELFLWPPLTGAETLEFLARLHGGTDKPYRDELVKRSQLDRGCRRRGISLVAGALA